MFGGGGNAEQGRNNSKNRMFLLLPVAVAGLGVLLVIVGVVTGHWLAVSFDVDSALKSYPENQRENLKSQIEEKLKKLKEQQPVFGLSNDMGDKHNNDKWCFEYSYDEHGFPKAEECGYLGAVTAMCVLGILAAGAGILLALGHVALGKTALMPAAGGAACLIAGLFTLIGVIIFATQSAEYREEYFKGRLKHVELVLGWSFALTTVGGVLFLAAGALMLVIVLVCK